MSSELKPTHAASSASVASKRDAAVWAIIPGEGSQKTWLVIATRRVRARLTGSSGVRDWSSSSEMGFSSGTSLARRRVSCVGSRFHRSRAVLTDSIVVDELKCKNVKELQLFVSLCFGT